MTTPTTESQSVVVERELPFPAERIWRALTQPQLIQEWLMHSDFVPVVGQRFHFRADWGSVDCQVLTLEPGTCLSYKWSAMGLDSVVTWTLRATSTGTYLRMEQKFFAGLERVVGGLS